MDLTALLTFLESQGGWGVGAGGGTSLSSPTWTSGGIWEVQKLPPMTNSPLAFCWISLSVAEDIDLDCVVGRGWTQQCHLGRRRGPWTGSPSASRWCWPSCTSLPTPPSCSLCSGCTRSPGAPPRFGLSRSSWSSPGCGTAHRCKWAFSKLDLLGDVATTLSAWSHRW